MATLKSTMGAPLTDDEEGEILAGWANLLQFADTLVRIPRDDQPAMLNAIADLVMLCSECRTAINNGWYCANNRAFPGPARDAPRARTPQISTAQALAALGITEDQIRAALSRESQ